MRDPRAGLEREGHERDLPEIERDEAAPAALGLRRDHAKADREPVERALAHQGCDLAGNPPGLQRRACTFSTQVTRWDMNKSEMLPIL